MSIEDQRLLASQQRTENWQRWGPYLSERQWGTVREDYSTGGDGTWGYFPHDHARSRAYRWGEDGLLGLSDRECRLCFSLALWNGRDSILKERLFGVTGPEGNHGEDVKECYYYLDSTPTHSYMRALYKYPQARFPYEELVSNNRKRGFGDLEYELKDTGVFDQSRYFDVQVEYAKAGPNDVLIRTSVTNRGNQPAVLHVLPQLWFRNTWTWQCTDEGCTTRPSLRLHQGVVQTQHESLQPFWYAFDFGRAGPESRTWLFTDNETNQQRHAGLPSESDFYKDAFHEYVVLGNTHSVNPKQRGTKAAAYQLLVLQPGQTETLRCRLSATDEPIVAEVAQADPQRFIDNAFGEGFEQVFASRVREADEYYGSRIPLKASDDQKQIMRQAYAGLLWTKQFYHYVVDTWMQGDPNGAPIPAGREQGRNSEWKHLFNRDVISMPDKWEYPWYAAWDLAFHMVPMAHLDPEFAKHQMLLFLREWYMHPSGMIPAYEWNLSDVNPPVHAWGVWQVYKASGPPGNRDKVFLTRAFQKLVINFTWWVNRKDPNGRNIFSGGFLGLDNIGVFDRSKPLPGGHLEQADGTSWMAFYCGTMLRIALELAEDHPAYGDMASKFFEHYVAIAEAMNTIDGTGLWEEEDGFYYDHLSVDGQSIPMKVRSLVGLMPLTTGVLLEEKIINKLPGFKKRMDWFLENRGSLCQHMTYMEREDAESGEPCRRLLAIPSEARFRRLLSVMLDENEFLSPFGVRSLSLAHKDQPFVFDFGGQRNEVRYVPGESDSGMFGGNSNWRGPVWWPTNYVLIEALERYHEFYGDDLRVECPVGSGQMKNLREVARELNDRLTAIFLPDAASGQRPCLGATCCPTGYFDWQGEVLFHEYFNGDTGEGLGASHQTGWTALVANCIERQTGQHPG
ncbi:MAG: glucosidase [Planctomycetota bacterium]